MAEKEYAEGSKPRRADKAGDTINDVVTKVTDTVPQVIAAAGAGAAIGAGAKALRNFKRGMDEVRRTNYLGGRDPKVKRMDNL